MLTVKAPIELKCRAGIVPSYESFVHRITGNYEMMSATVTGEDLLHLVTEPPEVFFAEGSVSTIINQTNINQNQENKLEILNQLLNRITVDSGLHMTYQDRVYITDMLQKLGVKNVQQFMRQVTQLKEETENTTELIDHYWNHMEQLQELIQSFKESREEKTENSEYRQEGNILHLHQDIMNRLQTGSIYQIVSNFNHNQSASAEYISGAELRSAEYYRITRNILLNTLENEARGENLPLEYRHENYYEEILPFTEEITEEKITNQIAAAVLLQLADNIYQNRHENIERRGDMWYTVSNAFYRSAENTMNRLHRNFVEQYYRSDRAGDYLVNLNKNYRQELALLDRIMTIREAADGRERIAPAQTTIRMENLQQHQEESLQTLVDNRSYREGDQLSLRQAGDTTEERNYRSEFSHEELYLNREQNSVENTEVNLSQTNSDTTTLQQNNIDVSNAEYYQKYLQKAEQVESLKDSRWAQTQAQEEAAEKVQQLEHVYLPEKETKGKEEPVEQFFLHQEQNSTEETMVNVRQEQQEVTLEQLEEFHRHNVENRNKYYQKLEQLKSLQEKPGKAPDLQRMRREGLLALERPQEMLQQLKEEGHEQQEQATRLRQQELALLPEETQRIYEVLEQYLQTPERYRQAEAATNRDIGRLMRDIELVERESREQTQTDIHTDRQINSRSETIEQNWLERPPMELHYQEEPGGGEAEAAPESRPTENAGTRELVERQLREQELLNTYTDRQMSSRSETFEQNWVERPSAELHYQEETGGEEAEAAPEGRPAETAGNRELVERLLREREQRNTHTDRQVSSRSETFEQSWLERPPAELYYDEGATGDGGRTAPQGRAAEPAGDRGLVERQLREQELLHSRTDKTLRDISETVVERWEENSRREPVQSAVTEEERRNRIALVHKQQTENEITEEIMEQLMNQNRVLQNQTRVMEEVTQNSRTVERRVTNQTTHEITQQTENLTEMISRGVQGRIGDITDQVYNRLEKRLQNERRRRGI